MTTRCFFKQIITKNEQYEENHSSENITDNEKQSLSFKNKDSNFEKIINESNENKNEIQENENQNQNQNEDQNKEQDHSEKNIIKEEEEEEINTKIDEKIKANDDESKDGGDPEFEKISKKRLRHNVEKRAKHHDELAESKNSLDDSLGVKSNFNKVSFEINIMYFFSKENKILDVYSDGIFTIYKKGKVK